MGNVLQIDDSVKRTAPATTPGTGEGDLAPKMSLSPLLPPSNILVKNRDVNCAKFSNFKQSKYICKQCLQTVSVFGVLRPSAPVLELRPWTHWDFLLPDPWAIWPSNKNSKCRHWKARPSVIFVLIYFLVLVLVLVFQLFFRFSFSFSFANNQIISNLLKKTCWWSA